MEIVIAYQLDTILYQMRRVSNTANDIELSASFCVEASATDCRSISGLRARIGVKESLRGQSTAMTVPKSIQGLHGMW